MCCQLWNGRNKRIQDTIVRTATENIASVINSGLIEIESVHIDYLNPDVKKENIPTDKLVAYLMYLSQSGMFADTIRWRHVNLFDNGRYLIEGDINHNNGYELNIAVAAKNIEDDDKASEILKESED